MFRVELSFQGKERLTGDVRGANKVGTVSDGQGGLASPASPPVLLYVVLGRDLRRRQWSAFICFLKESLVRLCVLYGC